MMVAVIFLSLLALLLIRVPIAVSLGLACVVGLATGGINLEIIVQRMVTTNDSFPLLAIPFFILAGEIMSTGGMSQFFSCMPSDAKSSFDSILSTPSLYRSNVVPSFRFP